MKKLLLLDTNQKFIGDLQTKLARRYEILATDNYNIAYRLIKTVEIDLMLARLPSVEIINQHDHLKKLLTKLNRKKFAFLTKILIAPEGNGYKVEEFLKLGIAAVIVDVTEIERWIK